uniref:Uncharacterized protein n=1 Tax=Haemonchus contortus TaxID=6289 RepID=A0A7I4XXN3_HAECO
MEKKCSWAVRQHGIRRCMRLVNMSSVTNMDSYKGLTTRMRISPPMEKIWPNPCPNNLRCLRTNIEPRRRIAEGVSNSSEEALQRRPHFREDRRQ